MKLVNCPFCWRSHLAYDHMNVLCPCGAKYYVATKEWRERRGLKRIIKDKEETSHEC